MPEDSKLLTETEALANEVRAAFRPELVALAHPHEQLSASVLALPDASGGITVQSIKKYLDEYRDRPERRAGVARLQTLDSLVEHANRHKGESSVLYADRGPSPSITAIYDYQDQGADGLADWARHRAVYPFPIAKEWTAWTKAEGKWLGMSEFAEFLDAHAADVEPPPLPEATVGLLRRFLELYHCKLAGPPDLLALAQGLTVHTASDLANHERRETGEIEIGFSTTVTRTTDRRGQAISVPGAFALLVPVFERGTVYEVPARLRYRAGAKVEWTFDLFRRQDVWDAAVEEACKHAASETALPLFYGAPEA